MNWNRFPMPYRRYVIGPVWRNESGANRLRQFTQCDFDTVGSTSPIIDAEIVAINYTILSRLGFKDVYQIKVNDRRLLDSFMSYLKIADRNQINSILRAWDKLEKNRSVHHQKRTKSRRCRSEPYRRFDRLTDKLSSLTDLTNDLVVTGLRRYFKSPLITKEIDRLESLTNAVRSMGVPDERFNLYPLLARGLDYYTGPILKLP